MGKNEAIKKLQSIVDDLNSMAPFAGRAQIIRDAETVISQLCRYRYTGNVPRLFVMEIEKKLKAAV